MVVISLIVEDTAKTKPLPPNKLTNDFLLVLTYLYWILDKERLCDTLVSVFWPLGNRELFAFCCVLTYICYNLPNKHCTLLLGKHTDYVILLVPSQPVEAWAPFSLAVDRAIKRLDVNARQRLGVLVTVVFKSRLKHPFYGFPNRFKCF